METSMVEKLARVFGPLVPLEVGWGRSGCEALNARADRHRNHVLLQSLVITDPGITSGSQNIDEAILSYYVQPDLRICREERWHDLGQHQACRTDWDIEPERTG